MPSPSTAPRSSLDHVHFTALPGTESVTAISSGTSTAIGTGSSLALTLKGLTTVLTSTKLFLILGSVLGVIALATTLTVIFVSRDGNPHPINSSLSDVTSIPSIDSSSSSSPSVPFDTSPTPFENTSSSLHPSTYSSSSSSSTLVSSSSSPSTSSSTSSTTSSTTSSSSFSTPTPSTTSSSSVTPSRDSTSTTPFRAVCQETEFTCNNGQCVDVTVMCDGIPDCSDGTDEGIPCACSSYQFTCANGQCIAEEGRCNGVAECIDKSDEMGCPDCPGFRCASDDLCLWDRMSRRCNGAFDCNDLSDEMNCRSRYGHRRCDNGIQILSSLWCNGVDDCRDNSDEKNCKCLFYELSCGGPDSQCISRSWRCDGFPDCDNGADETNCSQCQPNQFQCTDYSCVPLSARCDGKLDCPHGGADEKGCFSVDDNNIVHVMINDKMLPLCSEAWKTQHSSEFCSRQQEGPLQSWTSSSFQAPLFAILQEQSQNISLQQFTSSTQCKSSKVVRVRCQHSECGERQTQVLASFIAGGDITPLGKWPWVASIAYLRKPICGAAIIGRRWILTAAHCVMRPVPGNADFTSAPFYFTVKAGSTSITPNTTNNSSAAHLENVNAGNKQAESHFQTSRVSKIYLHPKAEKMVNGGVDWDLAVLELSTDLRYSDTVQPLCLPPAGYVFPRTSVCYVAGWGLLSYSQYLMPEKLRDTRMDLWSETKCRGNVVLGETEVNINSTICAGSFYGKPTACQGDSGSPLMCLEPGTSHWSLAGIMSRGQSLCGQFKPNSLGNRFARVSTSIDWIVDTMGGV